MASQTRPQHPFFLFTLFFFFFCSFIDAKLDLHPSDVKAIQAIQRDMGLLNGQTSSQHPCNSEGVFCQRRLSNNHTYFLRITRLVLNSMRLNGTLSPFIGRLTELKELSLPSNNVVDRIPHNIVLLTKLEILDLNNNLFSGEVPSQLSSLIRLRVLDVSSNRLSGNLNFLKHFPNLETLNIADNLFTGRVPPSLRSFRNLRHFNFSGNRLVEGSISLAKRLEREYSGSDYDTSVSKRFIFTEGSNELNSNTSQSPAPAHCSQSHHHHKKRNGKLAGWILGSVAGAFAVTISGFIFSLLFKLALALAKGEGKVSGPAIYSPLIKKVEDLAFLEEDDVLTNSQIIGCGGCGVVYKVELPLSNGKVIAIKKIILPSKGAAEMTVEDNKLLLLKKMRQIRSEIYTVGQIRHRNLLPLLAHVPRPECHYLLYEFMKNGSLQDLLNKVENGERELDWLSRHKIALGVAAGLQYLHMCHSPRVVHRDLKPANILLDDDMEARIADFGLAKVMGDAHTHITAYNVYGTAGYIAPECHRILKFSEKSDIYSFGVVLGVLVMGKFPYDEFFQHTDEMTLVRWMRKMMISENPNKAIDARLLGNGYEEQMILVLRIACFCTMEDPRERPNSMDVRCMLSQIKH